MGGTSVTIAPMQCSSWAATGHGRQRCEAGLIKRQASTLERH